MLNLRELGRKQRVLGYGDPKRQEHALMLEFARKESEMKKKKKKKSGAERIV